MAIFDDDVAVIEKGEGVFEGTVSDNWSVNGNPNGGYLMAILAGAMTAHSDKRSTPIMTANYVARCVPGSAEIRLEEVSRSAQFNRYDARLLQEGREKIRALGTFAIGKTECAVERYETGAPGLSPVESCVPIPEMPRYTLFHNLDMRLDPASAVWLQGKTAEKSEQKGWVRFRDGRTHDLLSLFLIADAIPPAIFVSQGPSAWVPTIELSTNIRNMPQTEWLRFCLRTRFVTCGLLEADGEVWDDAGNLVSISRQIAQLRQI
ncbi:MAG: thioesterase family protein [Spirochaetes bacterium]|nr:thioesterase family protein [Spirochaetota bacterium]